MSNTVELLLNAEFALAAYATLDNGTLDDPDQKIALRNAGMSVAQAERFSSNFSVVTQFNDGPGFSATVFKDSSNNLTLAIRGTLEIIGDILPTDNLILEEGAGYDQIISMYNWWLAIKRVSVD